MNSRQQAAGRRQRWSGGFTFTEVLISSILVSVVAGGTMMAAIAAARMTQGQNEPEYAEAGQYAQQTTERFRNRISCDAPWFDPLTCAPAPGMAVNTWQNDPLPAPGGNDSILNTPSARRYCITPADCDGVGGAGDCFTLQVRVCWDTTVCPAVGSSPC